MTLNMYRMARVLNDWWTKENQHWNQRNEEISQWISWEHVRQVKKWFKQSSGEKEEMKETFKETKGISNVALVNHKRNLHENFPIFFQFNFFLWKFINFFLFLETVTFRNFLHLFLVFHRFSVWFHHFHCIHLHITQIVIISFKFHPFHDCFVISLSLFHYHRGSNSNHHGL